MQAAAGQAQRRRHGRRHYLGPSAPLRPHSSPSSHRSGLCQHPAGPLRAGGSKGRPRPAPPPLRRASAPSSRRCLIEKPPSPPPSPPQPRAPRPGAAACCRRHCRNRAHRRPHLLPPPTPVAAAAAAVAMAIIIYVRGNGEEGWWSVEAAGRCPQTLPPTPSRLPPNQLPSRRDHGARTR